MRRITLLLSMLGLVVAGATGIVVGCGGAEEVAPPGNVADGAAATSGGETGASSSSSGGSTDPGDGGGSSTSSSSGGSGGPPPTNPGRLSCGASDCDAGGGFGGGGGFNRFVCCAQPNGGAATCTRQNDCDNQGPDSGLTMTCDEAADCDEDDRCCFVQTENNFPGPGGNQISSRTACQRRCQTGGGFGGGNGRRIPQVCKTSAECGDAGACAQKDCGGFKIFVCGSPEGCK